MERVVEVAVPNRGDESTEQHEDLKTKVAVLESTCDAAVQEVEDLTAKLSQAESQVSALKASLKTVSSLAAKSAATAPAAHNPTYEDSIRAKIRAQEASMKGQLDKAKRLREVLMTVQ